MKIEFDRLYYRKRHADNGVVTVYENGDQRYLTFNNLVQGRMNINDYNRPIVPYIILMCSSWKRFYNRDPKKVVNFGLGCGAVIRDLSLKYKRCRQIVFEYDKEIIENISRFFPIPKEIKIIHGNAVTLEFMTPWREWQWLLVDVFNGEGEIMQYMAEWWRDVSLYLAKNALVTLNLFSMKENKWQKLKEIAQKAGFVLLEKNSSLMSNWVVNWRYVGV